MATQSVSDFRSNENDQIVFAAKKIGRSEHKKAIFRAVYFGKKKTKTVEEIAESTKLSRKRVLEDAKKLVTAKLIHQTKSDGDTAYEKDDAYQGVWQRILKLAGDAKKIEKIPTKVNPKGSAKSSVTLKIPKNQAKIQQITIDEVESFKKVKSIKSVSVNLANMPETKFKLGVLKILNDKQNPKDWGGEKNDIYTTKLKISSKRLHAAFALKGPGQKVKKLTPKHMGKNGDQIQRLAGSSAQVFFVQYWGEIDQSVVDQMYQLALAKAFVEGRLIYFGVIDGEDSSRLIKAYPKYFK